MKNILFLLLFLFCTSTGSTQTTDKDWLISMDFGIQEHDKRLYHWPRFPRERLLARTPENYGTYQIGISISKKVIDHHRFSVYAGVGLSTEVATFFRPFDHLYGIEFGDYILLYTDRYYQNLLQLPLKTKFRFLGKLNATLDILPQFNFFTIADNTKGIPYAKKGFFSWWQFGLYSIELNPGLEYSIGKFNLGIKYRAFQTKKIDPILFF